MEELTEIDQQINTAERECRKLDEKKSQLLKKIKSLKNLREKISQGGTSSVYEKNTLTSRSSQKYKIALFRSLFKGREDVFPKRFESVKTGKSGYQPCCRNEWIRAICKKPKVKCTDCENRDFIPVTDDIIRNHLMGVDPYSRSKRDYTIGIYPLLPDETCWFLAVDFDKKTWMDDVSAYLETCKTYNVQAVLERSRSGNGGHVWIFFSEPVPAAQARRLGSFILTETMDRRPEIGLDSYDRFFPSQDIMPKGGFGNLIALPLQKKPRKKGNTIFLDDNLMPYQDQWAFLSTIKKMSLSEVEKIINQAENRGRIIGVKIAATDEDGIEPWLEQPSRKKGVPVTGPLPDQIKLVFGNQIYIEKAILSPSLRNRLIRLAAFQNPEFYKAQAMRFSTFDKPRIINCCEDFPKHIGIPRGCLEEIISLLKSLKIKVRLIDERFHGKAIDVKFIGRLRPEQEKAAEAMLHSDTGVLSASTAFGKTVIAAYLIAKRGVNTLILVHRIQLLDQWVARLSNFLEFDPKKIGQIGGGKRKPSGLIDVAIIQSISKKGTVDDIVGKYGYLVVDECHHISARSFEIAARQCKAKYVTGLSATVIRKDGHHPIIFMNCGPVRYKVDDRKQAEKRPFNHKVIVRSTNFQIPESLINKESLMIHELYAALIIDEKRNQMIVEDVVKAVNKGRIPVVLTERREHLEKLKSLLSLRVNNIFAMKGGIGKKQRKMLAEEMKAVDDERIILATGRYLGEGFDDPGLDTLFLTLPVSWKGTVAQYAGRLHRLHDTKTEVIIYDYADLNVPMLAKMYGRRVSGYKAIGYEINE
ncbi:MAG: DEAD/DEAH box helicase [Desulfosarcina sp.]|nr:DEAD/DEAH box helicase [Desulfobacterales bacterium]